MQPTTLAITGMGAVTPLGTGAEAFWQGLVEGRCGVSRIASFDPDTLPTRIAAQVSGFQPDCVPPALARNLAPFGQYAFVAAEQAARDAGLDAASFDPSRVAIVTGTAMDGMSLLAKTQDEMSRGLAKKASPRLVPMLLGNIPSSVFAMHRGFKGPCLTVNTACSSGGDAVMSAAMLILCGEADAALVMGGESIVSPILISSLSQAKALSRNNDNPQGACRPFDKDRDGFVIGEGGGALVIEPLGRALARGAKVHAILAGWASTQDAHHITAPDPNGAGAVLCMERALARAGMAKKDVGYVNAHGTSTVLGDKVEATAIAKVFGEGKVAVSSTKGATGHMMGAGGITECIACVKALQTAVLPPTLNCENPDPECGMIDIVRLRPRRSEIRAAMSNSLGFGGQNSSLIVARFDAQ